MTGPCSRCAEDHGKKPKHWRDHKGNLYLFCGEDCRQIFVAEFCKAPQLKAAAIHADRATPKKASGSSVDLRPRETDISKAIADVLDARVAWHTRIQSNQIKTASGHYVRGAREGTPDRVAAAGVMLWIEVKRPGEKPTPEQAETIAKLRANGSLAVVLDDADDARAVLDFLSDWRPHIERIAAMVGVMQGVLDHALEQARKRRNEKQCQR
jgi:hypothetical protein